MSVAKDFRRLLRQDQRLGARATDVNIWAKACAVALPVAGATMSSPAAEELRVALGASDITATLAHQLEFTLGNGPAFKVTDTGRAVVADTATMNRQWPELAQLLNQYTPYRAAVAVPLIAPTTKPVILHLWFTSTDEIGHLAPVRITELITELNSRLPLLGLTMNGVRGDPEVAWSLSSGSRELTTAMGLIKAELGLAGGDALAVLRAAAFSRGTTAHNLAYCLVEQSITPNDL